MIEVSSPCHCVAPSPRLLLATLLALFAIGPLEAQTSPPELEEATDAARRAATAAIRGSQRAFAGAINADGLLARRLGADTWNGLQERQREWLRSAFQERFLQSLAPPRSAAGEIAWSAPLAAGTGADVLLGLRFGEKILKTRWLVRHVGAGWRVVDVILSDPGISVGQTAVRALGPRPVSRRKRQEQAKSEAYPRLGGLAAIGMIVLLLASRLPRAKRPILYLTASAPAILLAIDGTLAVRRALTEPYSVQEETTPEPWRQAEESALQAERDGMFEQARKQWARALAEGGPAAPIEYQSGLAARRQGDLDRARATFELALRQPEPAPGAAKELASMAFAEGKFEQAEQHLARYLSLAGPDPESLAMQSVIKTDLGKAAQAVESIRQARRLVGDGWRGAELEAQIHARAGDAAGAVAALRPLEAQGRVDRFTLRADPSYLPIATDPAWVAFLSEKPSPPPSRTMKAKSRSDE